LYKNKIREFAVEKKVEKHYENKIILFALSSRLKCRHRLGMV
jgi:hypothetical protein